MPVQILNVRPTAPTTPNGTGSALIDIQELGPAVSVNVLVYATDATGANTGQPLNGGGATISAPALNYLLSGLAPGVFSVAVYNTTDSTDHSGIYLTIPPYTQPVIGCADRDADNFDATVTQADATFCLYSPRLHCAPAPPLLALQSGAAVALLSSADIAWSRTPGLASATITLLSPLSVGQTLLVNGYTFTVGTVPQPAQFQDLDSLVSALQAIPLLQARYLISLSGTVITLTARKPGTAANLSLISSNYTSLQVASVAGINSLRSQQYPDWHCFVEVWVYPTLRLGADPTDPLRPIAPVLAGSLESPYRDDNQYAFDLTSLLLPSVSLPVPVAQVANGLNHESGLAGYFLRYGERYAAVTGGFRKTRYTAQTPIAWVLNAASLLPEAVQGLRLLTARPPGVIRWQQGDPGPWLSFLAPAGALIGQQLVGYDALGAPEPPALILDTPQTGGVTHMLGWPAGNYDAELTLFARIDGLSANGPTITAQLVPGRAGTGLVFANGQGGLDYFLFEGIREEIGKREASTYASGRFSQLTLRASLATAYRLNSALLPYAEFRWALRELGNVAVAWAQLEGVLTPVNLTALSFSENKLTGEYTLAVDIEPCLQPTLGLSR